MLKEVQDGIRQLGHELALCPVADLEEDLASAAEPADGSNPEALVGRRFRQAMGTFHEEMQLRAASLDGEQEETKELLRRLAAFFGEDPNQANPDAILRACAEMVRQGAAAEALAVAKGLREPREPDE